MGEDWFWKKLECLNSKKNRLYTLIEIRGRLNETLNLEGKVIDCLLCSPGKKNCMEEEIENGTSKIKPVVLADDILRICLENLAVMKKPGLSHLFETALLQKLVRIRDLALEALIKELPELRDENDRKIPEGISLELLHRILPMVQDEDPQLCYTAFMILYEILEYFLHEPTVIDALKELLKQNDETKCRLYEMAVCVGYNSKDDLDKVEFILDHALNVLKNAGIELQGYIITILEDLGEHDHGFDYLEKRQVVQNLVKLIQEMEYKPLDQRFLKNIVGFFSEIASYQPNKIINRYPFMIRRLFKCLHTCDWAILPTVFSAIENLARTVEGVILLENNFSTDMKKVFETFSTYLSNLPGDLKKHLLASLGRMFGFGEELHKMCPILRRWFGHLTYNTYNLKLLMDIFGNPSIEFKIDALHLIRSICLYPWGIEVMMNTPGLFKYLLECRIESDNNYKEAKLRVVKVLAVSGVFDVRTHLKLRAYVRVVQNILDVAAEQKRKLKT